MPHIEKTDIIIIGAGIMGASCAFHLAEQGAKVAILEAQNAPAMGSTARSIAGVRVQFTEEVNFARCKRSTGNTSCSIRLTLSCCRHAMICVPG